MAEVYRTHTTIKVGEGRTLVGTDSGMGEDLIPQTDEDRSREPMDVQRFLGDSIVGLANDIRWSIIHKGTEEADILDLLERQQAAMVDFALLYGRTDLAKRLWNGQEQIDQLVEGVDQRLAVLKEHYESKNGRWSFPEGVEDMAVADILEAYRLGLLTRTGEFNPASTPLQEDPKMYPGLMAGRISKFFALRRFQTPDQT